LALSNFVRKLKIILIIIGGNKKIPSMKRVCLVLIVLLIGITLLPVLVDCAGFTDSKRLLSDKVHEEKTFDELPDGVMRKCTPTTRLVCMGIAAACILLFAGTVYGYSEGAVVYSTILLIMLLLIMGFTGYIIWLARCTSDQPT
jgi:hypothetical protein